jgi:hypothetical protein
MKLEEAYRLVSNLDFRKNLRRFAPKHSLILFDHRGEVVAVYRYKNVPDGMQQSSALKKHPGCLQIFGMPDWYASPQELQERIRSDLWIFAHMGRNS